MTVQAGLKRAQGQLATLIPHADVLTLTGAYTPGTGEDEYGNATGGSTSPGVSLPCHAARISSEDAIKAGMPSDREIWRIVINQAFAVQADSTGEILLSGGMTVSIAVTKVTGTNRTIVFAQEV